MYGVRSDIMHGRTHNVVLDDRLRMFARFQDMVRRLWRSVLSSPEFIDGIGTGSPPHPSLSPREGGRGLRRVGEAEPSLTRSWVRGGHPIGKVSNVQIQSDYAGVASFVHARP
jgi:hypothetical protein